jgi:hypothetical protein
LQIQVAKKNGREVTPTPASYGATILNIIREHRRREEFVSDGPSALEQCEYDELKSISDEHQLVNALTKHLEKIFTGMAVVNSETFPWLYTGPSSALQKPDLFVCPVSFYTKRIPGYSCSKVYHEHFRYGTIVDERLYDGVVLIDCKLTCTKEAFGELCIHLEHLGLKQNSPTKGMLISKKNFWLYEQQNGVPIRFISDEWTKAGSFQAIQSFFEFPLNRFRKIEYLCDELKVVALDPHSLSEGESGFLGQGGFGRVIKVLPKAVEGSSLSGPLALKFVQRTHKNAVQLQKEHSILQEHASRCKCGGIASVFSAFALNEEFCGFLLKEVGSPCSLELIFNGEKPILKKVLMSLYALHTHTSPIFHGDARLANLIVVDDRLVWIDLMQYDDRVVDPQLRFSFDMHTLVQSLLPSIKTYDDQDLCNLIDSYSANPSPSSIEALEKYLLRNLTTATGRLKG